MTVPIILSQRLAVVVEPVLNQIPIKVALSWQLSLRLQKFKNFIGLNINYSPLVTMDPFMGGMGTGNVLVAAGPVMATPAGYYNGTPYNNGFNPAFQQGYAAGQATGVAEGVATGAALCCCLELCCCCLL